MDDLIHSAVIGARDVLGAFVKERTQKARMPEDQQLARYYYFHRGPANAINAARFVQQNAPQGADLHEQWKRYEQTMEEKLRQRGIITAAGGG